MKKGLRQDGEERTGETSGTNTDLMKKGLRQPLGGEGRGLAMNEHRPDEKGIATWTGFFCCQVEEGTNTDLMKKGLRLALAGRIKKNLTRTNTDLMKKGLRHLRLSFL